MKRRYPFFARFYISALFLVAVLAANGQPHKYLSFDMPLFSGAQGDTVVLPVSVQNLLGVLSMQYHFSWPVDDLEFLGIDVNVAGNPMGITNANILFTSPGVLTTVWFDQNAVGVTLPDSTILYGLKFLVKTPDAKFIPIRLKQYQSPWGLEVVQDDGGYYILPLRVGGVYANMPVPNAPVIHRDWEPWGPPENLSSIVSGGTPPYSFSWTGPGGFTSTAHNLDILKGGTYRLTITDQAGIPALLDLVNDQEALPSTCFSLGMPKVSGAENDVVTIPVSVQNFEDIISMQFSLHWSAEDMEMASPVSFNPDNPLGLTAANFNTSVPGLLKFIWFDPNTLGLDLQDSTVLFNLHFKVNSAQAEYIPVRFGPTNGLVYEVYAESADLMILSLRTGGVYANMAVPAGLPVVDEICSTPASSNCVEAKGSAYPVVSGGVPPYTFQWSGPDGFTSTEQNITDLVYGEYQLTVTDRFGATTLADVAISVDAIPLVISGTAQNASCSGADGCIDLLATTSHWPVSFAWSAPGLSGQDVCNLDPGTYTVTATDAGNCTSVQTFEVLLENELLIDAQATPANCANGQPGSAVVLPLNGVPPYDYLWSNNVTSQANLGLSAGLYGVTVTDSLGCTGVGNVEIGDASVSDWDLVLVIDCPGGNSGNLLLLSDNPSAPAYPLTVEWSNGTTVIVPAPNDTLSLLEMTPSGLYSVLVTDSLGCSVFLESALSCFGSSLPDSEALVWPGDADNNNAVNHHDLLYLGLAYGATGTPRAGATNDWTGQPADDWGQNTTGRVVNFKNMDTNGDGLVGAGDTAAIVANWGRVVDPLADNPFAPPLAVPGGGSGSPVPSMTLAADTLFAGQTTYIPVILGTSDNPADSLHGLAFSLAYNPKVLTPKYFEPVSSWFGDPDNGLLCMQRHFEGQNRIDVALSRTDGFPAGGFGLIGRMFIIIEDDIFFRKNDLGEPESEDDATITTRMFFRNIRLLSASNTSAEATPNEAKVTVSQTVGTAQPGSPRISMSVWPNPASENVRISVGAETRLRSVTISDLTGKLRYQASDLSDTLFTVPVRHWAPGTYLVHALTDRGTAVCFLVVEN